MPAQTQPNGAADARSIVAALEGLPDVTVVMRGPAIEQSRGAMICIDMITGVEEHAFTAEILTEPLHARGFATLHWEPACEHLIGVDYDRYLARHMVAEIQAVIEAASRWLEVHAPASPLHMLAIGPSTPFACSTAVAKAVSTVVVIDPMIPSDVLALAASRHEHAQPLPLGLVETVTELDPLANLRTMAGRGMVIARAASRSCPVESAWAYRSALLDAGNGATMLNLARGGRIALSRQTAEFLADQIAGRLTRIAETTI